MPDFSPSKYVKATMSKFRPGGILQLGPALADNSQAPMDLSNPSGVPPDLFDVNQPHDAMIPPPLPSRGIRGLGYPSQPGGGGFEIPTSLPANEIPSYNSERDDVIDYTPEHAGIDKINELMKTMPLRGDYHPSTMRKIFGGIAAGLGGGVPAWEYITQGPYREAEEDWANQFGVADKLASQERGANALERQYMTSALNERTAAHKLALGERAQDEKERANRVSEEIKRDRADVYRYKAEHPNHTYKTDEKGFVYSIDPSDDSTQYLVDPDGNKIKSGDLNDRDKALLGLSNALKLESTRFGHAKELEDLRQKNRSALITERAEARKKAFNEDKRLSVSQDAQAWKLARTQHIADWPSHSHFWDDSGNPTADAETDDTGTYESALEDVRKRYNTIKGRASASPSAVTTPGPTKPIVVDQSTKGPLPAGMVRVVSPDGKKTGTMPRKNVSTLPPGWKVIEDK